MTETNPIGAPHQQHTAQTAKIQLLMEADTKQLPMVIIVCINRDGGQVGYRTGLSYNTNPPTTPERHAQYKEEIHRKIVKGIRLISELRKDLRAEVERALAKKAQVSLETSIPANVNSAAKENNTDEYPDVDHYKKESAEECSNESNEVPISEDEEVEGKFSYEHYLSKDVEEDKEAKDVDSKVLAISNTGIIEEEISDSRYDEEDSSAAEIILEEGNRLNQEDKSATDLSINDSSQDEREEKGDFTNRSGNTDVQFGDNQGKESVKNPRDYQLTTEETLAKKANEISCEMSNQILAVTTDEEQSQSVESNKLISPSQEGEFSTTVEEQLQKKRGPGRPKGSKNKPKETPSELKQADESDSDSSTMDEGEHTSNVDVLEKRKPGRPKGLKNKPKSVPSELAKVDDSAEANTKKGDGEPTPTVDVQEKKRGRGRPKGSKNKPKETPSEVAKVDDSPASSFIVDEGELTSTVEVQEKKRGRGRPKGSKNKPKAVASDLKQTDDSSEVVSSIEEGEFSITVDEELQKKRGRGRPKGSKDKPKETPSELIHTDDTTVLSSTIDKGELVQYVDVLENGKRGRPKGSENKSKVTPTESSQTDYSSEALSSIEEVEPSVNGEDMSQRECGPICPEESINKPWNGPNHEILSDLYVETSSSVEGSESTNNLKDPLSLVLFNEGEVTQSLSDSIQECDSVNFSCDHLDKFFQEVDKSSLEEDRCQILLEDGEGRDPTVELAKVLNANDVSQDELRIEDILSVSKGNTFGSADECQDQEPVGNIPEATIATVNDNNEISFDTPNPVVSCKDNGSTFSSTEECFGEEEGKTSTSEVAQPQRRRSRPKGYKKRQRPHYGANTFRPLNQTDFFRGRKKTNSHRKGMTRRRPHGRRRIQ